MITIIKPGLLTSIQDLGRYGYQKFGVIASGVMDPLSHRIANILIGNSEKEPTLEITLLGPVIKFEKDAVISICGGDLSPSINGESVQLWRPVFVEKGSLLKFGSIKKGCRAYLAVAGGFEIPMVMGSKSTYLRGGIGGFNGRALKSGDQVQIGFSNSFIHYFKKQTENSSFIEAAWSITPDLIPDYAVDVTIRVTKGRQFDMFTNESQEAFFNEPFIVTNQSDRMGYRLSGALLALRKPHEILSEAVNFGTIQAPAEGNPIVLLADRQTTGGYPKIGQIISVDLPIIAQAKPGDRLHFTEISHEDSQRFYLENEKKIRHLKQGIRLKLQ